MNTKPTATPYKTQKFVGNNAVAIVANGPHAYASGIQIADVWREEDAEFIVRACNRDHLFENMLDALCNALPFVEDSENDPAFKKGVVKKQAAAIHALIKKVESSIVKVQS